ncbi:unnamed protein product, partial [Didymodactylos carnosus]
LGSYVKLEVEQDLVQKISDYLTEMKVTKFQLFLTSYCVFLYKLTQGTDLCVGGVNANRYESVLENLAGMFVNTIPNFHELKPTETFNSIMKQVQKAYLEIKSYSYLPY